MLNCYVEAFATSQRYLSVIGFGINFVWSENKILIEGQRISSVCVQTLRCWDGISPAAVIVTLWLLE